MAYTRVNWQDLPSTTTPINATNLNKMDSALKEHDEKLLGNASMGNVVVDSIRTKNIFDKNSLINGSINATTGAYTYQNYIVVSDYIWLSAGTYTIKMNNSSNIYLHTSCAYNSSKTYSSTLWGETTNTQRTFTLSADSYVRISFRNTSYSAITPSDVGNTNIQLEKGSTATSYSPYQNLNNDVSTGQVNLEIPTTAVELNAYAKSGKVASLKLTITIQNEVGVSVNTRIGTNLPKPNKIFSANGWEFFGVSKSDKSNIRCRIDENGTLTFWYLNNQIPAGTQLYFFTTYITND